MKVILMMYLNQSILQNIQKSLGKSSRWIIDSVIDHNISISKNNPLARSSYIKLAKELDHPKKGLINIQNSDDNVLKYTLAKIQLTISLIVLSKKVNIAVK